MPAGKSAVLGLVGVVACAASRIAAAQTVADPLGEAMRSDANDPWVVVKFDWNEDGRDDLLITSKQNIAMAGREGGTWSVWLSNGSGTYDMAGILDSPPWPMTVARVAELGNAKAVLMYSTSGGGVADIVAYYLDASHKVQTQVLGTVDTTDPARAAQSEALEKRIFGSAVRLQAETIPAGRPPSK